MRDYLMSAEHLLIGGHRGCICQYPENSIAAMQEGVRRGAAYLEIDIQLSKDCVPVVFHDVRLEQKTRLRGYVHEHELKELKCAVEGMCTLEEALVWAAGAGAYLALEVKTIPLDMQPWNMLLVDKIGTLLKKNTMMNRVFVFGQDYMVLKHYKQSYPDAEIGLTVPFVPANPVQLMKEMNALVYLSYIYNMTPEIIHDLQANGYAVSGAILRDEKWAKRAIELGVNMFESDYPEQYAGCI